MKRSKPFQPPQPPNPLHLKGLKTQTSVCSLQLVFAPKSDAAENSWRSPASHTEELPPALQQHGPLEGQGGR